MHLKDAPVAWAELLTRYGFPVDPAADGTLQVHTPETVNVDLLSRILQRLGHPDALDRGSLCLRLAGEGDEVAFTDTYRALCRRGDGYVEPGIAALVQVFREIGLITVQSCEGHLPGEGRRQATRPYIQFDSGVAGLQALALLQVVWQGLDRETVLDLNGDCLSIGHPPRSTDDERHQRQRQLLLDAAHLLRTHLDAARKAAQCVRDGYYLLWEPIDDALD